VGYIGSAPGLIKVIQFMAGLAVMGKGYIQLEE
jgi:hypothetical protein